jgi:hypothetical protein
VRGERFAVDSDEGRDVFSLGGFLEIASTDTPLRLWDIFRAVLFSFCCCW